MKLYMSVDMEGITGLNDVTFIDSTRRNYERGQRIMTAEANHIIETAFEEGCTEVVVNDSHSKMNNLLIEKIHPQAKLISGDVKPFSMVQGLNESYAGAVFLGYHARASQRGVLSHTMIFGVRNIYINDVVVGELGFNAYVAGYYNVPVLLVAGDNRAAAEAEELIPGVYTAAVKEYISRTSALCLTPQQSGRLLREKMKVALDNRDKIKPLVPPEKPLLAIEFTNAGQAEWASLMPGTEAEEGSTIVRFHAKDILEAYRAMLVMTELAMQTTFC
ncbi:M55 family metallopeptidase [Aneurinibacillus sp. Ricciae_BoGa-3]|uniref:M55 family metallopeptidase n=1 Tax=Aneurinibacillus sp. Ricciae_BoGa-3 TaxID=3022697 RepID=UPI00234044E1|nr:M55 family metallopeptidase [Aneurinibacillus sp. Ricciae_BoGa-3]WCK55564.1 M55 family metallopeptidase [Aneurinibacillus sp. Ricciae_BoGa-3]